MSEAQKEADIQRTLGFLESQKCSVCGRPAVSVFFPRRNPRALTAEQRSEKGWMFRNVLYAVCEEHKDWKPAATSDKP